MKLWLTLFLALQLSLPSHANEAAPLAEDPVVEQRLIVIAEELRCLVCQNESLAGSRADLAMDLRREVRNLIKSGFLAIGLKTLCLSQGILNRNTATYRQIDVIDRRAHALPSRLSSQPQFQWQVSQPVA